MVSKIKRVIESIYLYRGCRILLFIRDERKFIQNLFLSPRERAEKRGRERKFKEVIGRGAERRECISRQAKYFSRLTRASKADASFPILEASGLA